MGIMSFLVQGAKTKLVGVGQRAYRSADRNGLVSLASTLAARVITAENLGFFRSLPVQIREFDREVSTAIQELMPEAILLLDHFYLASNGAESYSQFRAHIIALGGKGLREVQFKGRRFSVLALPPSSSFGVSLMELGEPKPGQPEPNRLAHVSYLLRGDDSEKLFHELLRRLENPDRTGPVSLCGGRARITFLRRDIFEGELTGCKISVVVDGKDHEVEIRKTPL